jgi:Toprim domain
MGAEGHHPPVTLRRPHIHHERGYGSLESQHGIRQSHQSRVVGVKMVKFTPETSTLGGDGPRHGPRRLPKAAVAELAARLRDDAEAVARALLPNRNWGRANRKELRSGTKGSLLVNIAGNDKGKWKDFETGEGGDMLDLAKREMGEEAGLEWARKWVGNTGDRAPARPRVSEAERAKEGAKRAEAKANEDAKKRVAAKSVWDRGVAPEGTQVEPYLTSRGCWPLPDGCDAVRYIGSTKNSDGKDFPALLVRASKPDGTFCGIQRTYLDREGEPRKAAGAASPKETKGILEDGAVWLTAPGAHDHMILAEGLETGLSLWQAAPDTGVVVALGVNNYANVAMPDTVRTVTIAVDVNKPDKNGRRAGEQHARIFADKWTAEGREVRLAFPGPVDGPECDFNDLLRTGGIEAVRAALAEAEVLQPRKAKIDADAKHDLIVSAHNMAVKARERATSKLIQDVEPPSPPKTLPLKEAEARIRTVLDRAIETAMRAIAPTRQHLKRIARRAAWKDARDLSPSDPRYWRGRERAAFLVSRRAAHMADFKNRLEAAGWLSDEPVPPPLLVTCTVGLGKTHQAMAAIKRAWEGSPIPVSVVWLVPEYELAAQAAGRFHALGIKTYIVKGRGQKHANGDPLCDLSELADEVGKSGASVRSSLCNYQGARCAFRNTCGYYEQGTSVPDGNVVIIAAHNAVSNGILPGDILFAGITIIDETPIQQMALGDGLRRSGTVDGLRVLADREDGPWVNSAVRKPLQAFVALAEQPELGGADWKKFLIDRGVGRVSLIDASLAGALDALSKALSASMIIGTPGDPEGVKASLGRSRGKLRDLRDAIAIVEALARDWDQNRPRLQSFDVRFESERGGEPVRRWHAFGAPHTPPDNLPFIVLDATANEGEARTVFGKNLQVELVEVEQNLFTTQIASHTFSRAWLGIVGEKFNDDPGGVRNRERMLRFMIRLAQKHGPGNLLVITYKTLATCDSWKTAAKEHGFLLKWFGALSGHDDAKDCGALAVIGREISPPLQVEDSCRVLYAHDPKPLLITSGTPAHWYSSTERGFWLADGRPIGANVDTHGDPRVAARLGQVRDAGLTQAIGRLRAARAVQPNALYLFNRIPTGLPVHHLAALDEIEQLVELDAAVDIGGPLPLERTTLSEKAPGIFIGRDGETVGRSGQFERIRWTIGAIINKSISFRHALCASGSAYITYMQNRIRPLVAGYIPDVRRSYGIAVAKQPFSNFSREKNGLPSIPDIGLETALFEERLAAELQVAEGRLVAFEVAADGLNEAEARLGDPCLPSGELIEACAAVRLCYGEGHRTRLDLLATADALARFSLSTDRDAQVAALDAEREEVLTDLKVLRGEALDAMLSVMRVCLDRLDPQVIERNNRPRLSSDKGQLNPLRERDVGVVLSLLQTAQEMAMPLPPDIAERPFMGFLDGLLEQIRFLPVEALPGAVREYVQ